MDMICLMFECQDRGVLATSGVPWTNQEIAASISGNPTDNLLCLEELLAKGVARRNEHGAVYCKRLVLDQEERIRAAERQRELRKRKAGEGDDLEEDEESRHAPVTPLSHRSSSSSSTSTSKKEEKPLRPAKTPDDRAKHPAMIAVRDVKGRFPHKDVWDLVIEALGSHPDVQKLKRCWIEWRSRNYNPEDLGWLVDWYANGIPERRNQNGPQRETASQRNVRNIKESLADYSESEVPSRDSPPDFEVPPRLLASGS